MVKTLRPWSILDPLEYAEFVERNILTLQPSGISRWKAAACKFRVCIQKLLGEHRLTRYEWMITEVGVFFLLHAYRMKTTVRDLYGLDPTEHKNLIFKFLLPKITQNLKDVIKDFGKMIRRLLSLRYDEDEQNSRFDATMRQSKIRKRYAKRHAKRLILNSHADDSTDEEFEQPSYQSQQRFVSSAPPTTLSAQQCAQRFTGILH